MPIFGCFVLQTFGCNLTLLPFRCSIDAWKWNLWQMVRLWTTRLLTVHVHLSKFSSQFEDEISSWNFLVRSHFVKNESIDTGQIQDVVKNSNWPSAGTRFHRVQPSHVVGNVYITFSLVTVSGFLFSSVETLTDKCTDLRMHTFFLGLRW